MPLGRSGSQARGFCDETTTGVIRVFILYIKCNLVVRGSWFVVRGSWSSFFMYLQYCGKIFLGNCSDRLLLSSSPPSILKIIMPRKRASEHRLVLELSVGLSFDQRQAQWRIYLFWQQLQALSARYCRSLARNLHSSGYTQSTCSQGGGPCEGFEKRWRTTTTSVRGV